MRSAAVPGLLKVTICGLLPRPSSWLPKLKLGGETTAAGATPVPARVMGDNAELLLLLRDNDPLRLPVVVGTKVRLMLQLAPAARLPQELVWAKSPVTVIPVMVRGASPLLVRVAGCGVLAVPTSWFVKVRFAGVQEAIGACPFPARVAEGTALLKSPDTVMLPVRVPRAVGVKVTLITQLVPGASEAPQVLVWANSPVAWMPLKVMGILPVLVSVSVCAALVVPTTWLPNVRDVGESVPALVVAVPEMLTDDGVAVKSPVIVSDPVNGPDWAPLGAKTTLSVQLAPTAITPEQLFVT